ncbi:MAG TPA: hypothetical protein VLT59_17000, partial [Steroidobacteraceae bacterium]|nr:hypothetical protein [Steroidobacteraceae bacterium]
MLGFEAPVSPELVRHMLSQVAHRGPDDQGLYVSPDRRCALAHARLSVVDLSASGHQPMSNEDATVWIVCNGEIYNSPELRWTLERRGHRFRSRSDTEVILHLYEDVGTDVSRHLDGMFAFALYDIARARLLLSRDHMGKKPLYYARANRAVLFASEPRALLAHPGVTADLDLDGLGQYLAFRTTAPPRT